MYVNARVEEVRKGANAARGRSWRVHGGGLQLELLLRRNGFGLFFGGGRNAEEIFALYLGTFPYRFQ